MKNSFFLFVAVLFFSATLHAQSTADSIKAKYQMQAMPEALTVEKTFPVVGSYQLSAADAASQSVTVTLDPENKGTIWIEGLPQGKMKAYLKKSPSTYRIVAQKTDGGKEIPEGTLIFDPSSRNLNIALGKTYNDADPAAIFNLNGNADADMANTDVVKIKSKQGTVKTKTKVLFYNAVKVDATTTVSN